MCSRKIWSICILLHFVCVCVCVCVYIFHGTHGPIRTGYPLPLPVLGIELSLPGLVALACKGISPNPRIQCVRRSCSYQITLIKMNSCFSYKTTMEGWRGCSLGRALMLAQHAWSPGFQYQCLINQALLCLSVISVLRRRRQGDQELTIVLGLHSKSEITLGDLVSINEHTGLN